MNNKQIIIFSEENDISTTNIMKYCKIAGCDVRRINSDDKVLKINISKEYVKITTAFDIFDIDKNSICWFRRSELPSVYIKYQNKNSLQDSIEVFNFIEHKQAFNALKLWVKQNCKLSSYLLADSFNKVDVLLKASETGIQVPDWIVAGEKKFALKFAKKYEFVACKSFSSFFFYDENATYQNLTEKLQLADIKLFENYFTSRFFQQYIEKKYELRSFYFHGKFFTYAILSQNNTKTAIDFRNYDNDKPNRCVPFALCNDYCEKLNLLMQKLNLDTGSCDILVDENDNYYFLEVNPVGQFGYGSFMCNENIDNFIANYLMNTNL
jgi:ATP-GRASP peptide maturase of grasp-with-spasm system